MSLREWNLSASATPALVILDTLVDDGWRAGRPPAAHTLHTPRIFTRPTRMTQLGYWRCLAMLRDLCVTGVPEFLSGKPQQYYVNLLAALSRGDGAVTAAITEGTARRRADGEQSDSSADDGGDAVAQLDVPMAPLAQARPLESMPVARKNAKRTRAAMAAVSGNADDGSALWHVVPRALPLEQEVSVTDAAPAAEAASAAAAGRDDAGVSSTCEVLAPVVPRVASLETIVDVLEGLPVRVEERGMEGMPGYYRRIFVTCPLHTLPGAMPCRVRRNTGRRQTGKLGVQEPLAYLGAWLAAGSACASREEHMAAKPSDAETRAYALRSGLA